MARRAQKPDALLCSQHLEIWDRLPDNIITSFANGPHAADVGGREGYKASEVMFTVRQIFEGAAGNSNQKVNEYKGQLYVAKPYCHQAFDSC